MGNCIFKSSKDELCEEVDKNSVPKRKIVMIGLDNSGKTALLNYFKNNQFQQTTSTVGLNIETIQMLNQEFIIFDVGGKVRSL